jgi:hypothetical protein
VGELGGGRSFGGDPIWQLMSFMCGVWLAAAGRELRLGEAVVLSDFLLATCL